MAQLNTSQVCQIYRQNRFDTSQVFLHSSPHSFPELLEVQQSDASLQNSPVITKILASFEMVCAYLRQILIPLSIDHVASAFPSFTFPLFLRSVMQLHSCFCSALSSDLFLTTSFLSLVRLPIFGSFSCHNCYLLFLHLPTSPRLCLWAYLCRQL